MFHCKGDESPIHPVSMTAAPEAFDASVGIAIPATFTACRDRTDELFSEKECVEDCAICPDSSVLRKITCSRRAPELALKCFRGVDCSTRLQGAGNGMLLGESDTGAV